MSLETDANRPAVPHGAGTGRPVAPHQHGAGPTAAPHQYNPGPGRAGPPHPPAGGRGAGLGQRLGVPPGGLPPVGELRERISRDLRDRFRMPGQHDSSTRLRRLAGVAAWAAVLGLGGLVAGVRAVVGLFTSLPGWYLPVFVVIGLIGIALCVGAFASVHRRRTPWILLGAATFTLILAWIVNFAS